MTPVRMKSRAEFLFIAKLAEEAERYDDVLLQIKGLIYSFDARLTAEERNLLSVAYKNKTNTLRNSWRIVDTLEKLEASRAHPRLAALVQGQRKHIERELADACKDAVRLLDDRLVPRAKAGEEKVFYWKMKGDYYRYLVEFAEVHERRRFADLSLESYKFAYQHSLTALPPAHPTRLGLALNFSVYYHDVHGSPDRACHLAKHAFDEAIASMDSSGKAGEQSMDSLMILQLLKDDLVLWAGEI
ncbi:hypothetical protein PLICRDRAFT_33652 [Plicaturopsis crispa FD-325 SS-3]|nr:hypothetical protein PLICRDRAFT_33652 [Plicaturopsis crispa FD-325 SS-3]